jgi:hypothetical protein
MIAISITLAAFEAIKSTLPEDAASNAAGSTP